MIVNPVIGRCRNRQAGAGQIAFRDRVFAVISANMAVQIKEAQYAAPFFNTAPREFAPELLGSLV
ncbi:hypothetical protein D3C83_35260 [compost metagenome]